METGDFVNCYIKQGDPDSRGQCCMFSLTHRFELFMLTDMNITGCERACRS